MISGTDHFREFVDKARGNLGDLITFSDKQISKIVTLISAGAFAVSVTYLSGSEKVFYSTDILLIAWSFLLMTILMHIWSYHLSKNAFMEKSNLLNKVISDDKDVLDGKRFNTISKEVDDGIKMKISGVLDSWSLIFFTIGIAALGLFAFINIRVSNEVNRVLEQREEMHQQVLLETTHLLYLRARNIERGNY